MRLTAEQQRLVEENQGLVYHAIERFYGLRRQHPDFEDVVAVGMIGLCNAAAGFDLERGCRFSTHATWQIRGTISVFLKQLRRQRGAILPEDVDPDREVPRAVTRGCDYERLRTAVWGMIATLPRREQIVMRRRYFDGWAFLQIGEELGLCKQMAARIHVRALKLLGERWPEAERLLEVA